MDSDDQFGGSPTALPERSQNMEANRLTAADVGMYSGLGLPSMSVADMNANYTRVRVGDTVIAGTQGFFGYSRNHPAIVTHVFDNRTIAATVIPCGGDPFPLPTLTLDEGIGEIPEGKWRFR